MNSKLEIFNIVLLFILIVIVAIHMVLNPPNDSLYLVINIGVITSYFITAVRCYDNYKHGH